MRDPGSLETKNTAAVFGGVAAVVALIAITAAALVFIGRSDDPDPGQSSPITVPLAPGWTVESSQRPLTPLPASPLVARRGVATAVTEGRMFVFGGVSADHPLDPVALADGALYDPSADAWTEIAESPLGAVRSPTASTMEDGRVFVWGGTPHARRDLGSSQGAIYDPTSDSWDEITDAPVARVGAVSAVAGSLVYVAGGSEDELPADDVILVYDLETDEWSTISLGRRGLAVVSDHASGAWAVSLDRGQVALHRLEPGQLPDLLASAPATDDAYRSVGLVPGSDGPPSIVLEGDESSILSLNGDMLEESPLGREQLTGQASPLSGVRPAASAGPDYLVGQSRFRAQMIDTATMELTGFELPRGGACGTEGAIARLDRTLVVWGGRPCDSTGRGVSANGWRIDLAEG